MQPAAALLAANGELTWRCSIAAAPPEVDEEEYLAAAAAAQEAAAAAAVPEGDGEELSDADLAEALAAEVVALLPYSTVVLQQVLVCAGQQRLRLVATLKLRQPPGEELDVEVNRQQGSWTVSSDGGGAGRSAWQWG